MERAKEKKCLPCGKMKSVSEFHKGKATKDGYHAICKVCACAYDKARRNSDLKGYYEKRKKWRKKNRFAYSLTASKNMAKLRGYIPCTATAEELEAAFTGFCDLCHVPELECTKKLSVDHNHETGEFRGWLCQCCNAAIGMLKNSREIALNAVFYIQQHENETSLKG